MASSDDRRDWHFVSQSAHHDKESVDDTQSEGSIEVVSMEADDLEDHMMEQSGSQQPPSSTQPYFILRVPNSDHGLTTETDSSDDSEGNTDFRVIRHRKTTLTRNDHKEDSTDRSSSPSLSSFSPLSSREATPEHFTEQNDRMNLAVLQLGSESNIDHVPSSEEDEIASQHDFEMIHIEDHLAHESVNVVDAVDQVPETDNSIEANEPNIVPHEVQMEGNVTAADAQVGEENVPAAVEVPGEENVSAPVAVNGEENVAAVVAQEVENAAVPADIPHDRDDEGDMEDEQFELIDHHDGLDTESAAEMEDEDDRIESDQSTEQSQHSDDNSNISNLDIGDLMADPGRIRQYVHQPNSNLNVTLNTICVIVLAVAIGLGIGHAIGSKRERLMQRRMWQDNFGHSPKVPSTKPLTDSPLLEKTLAEKIVLMTEREKKLEEDIKHLVWKIREMEAVGVKYAELQKEYQEIYEKYSLKEKEALELEALQNEKKLLNETVEQLQNELIRMKEVEASLMAGLSQERDQMYEIARLTSEKAHLSAALEEQRVNVQNLEEILAKLNAFHASQLRMKEKSWKNIVNMLEMEKQDLVKEIGNLRYSPHPGNDAVENQAHYKERLNQLETEKSDLIRQVGSMRYSSYMGNDASSVRYSSNPSNTASSSVGEDRQVEPEIVDGVDVKSEDDEEFQAPGSSASCYQQLQDLNRELSAEQQRSDMWQRLYMKSQKEHKQTRTDNSSRDFFGCVTYLLRNVTVPQNLSKMLKEKVDLSLDALKYIYNVFKGEDPATQWNEEMKGYDGQDRDSHSYPKGSKQDKQKYRNTADKQGKGTRGTRLTWKETMEEVLNKTKSSVSDVSKQIHDTWQQVKNLSKDLWKKHEPALEKFQKEMSEKVDKFTAHVQKKLKETTGKWFRKEEKEKKQSEKKRKDDKENGNEGDGVRASTSRRAYDHGEDRKWRRQDTAPTFHPNENRQERNQHNRSIEKLKTRVSRIGRKKFCKMDFWDRETIFNALDKVDGHETEIKESWQSCQWDWWWNAISHHLDSVIIIQPECSQWLQAWQIEISNTGDWLCQHRNKDFNKPGHGNGGHHHGSGRKCWKNRAHTSKKSKLHWENPRPDGKAQRKQSFKHNHRRSDRHHPTRGHTDYLQDDMKIKPTLAEESHLSNTTHSSYFGCDPHDEECNRESFSWFIQQMHHRDQQRLSEEIQAERAKWLFSRGRAREEQRNREEDEERRASWQFRQAKLREESRSEDQGRHDDDDVTDEDKRGENYNYYGGEGVFTGDDSADWFDDLLHV